MVNCGAGSLPVASRQARLPHDPDESCTVNTAHRPSTRRRRLLDDPDLFFAQPVKL